MAITERLDAEKLREKLGAVEGYTPHEGLLPEIRKKYERALLQIDNVFFNPDGEVKPELPQAARDVAAGKIAEAQVAFTEVLLNPSSHIDVAQITAETAEEDVHRVIEERITEVVVELLGILESYRVALVAKSIVEEAAPELDHKMEQAFVAADELRVLDARIPDLASVYPDLMVIFADESRTKIDPNYPKNRGSDKSYQNEQGQIARLQSDVRQVEHMLTQLREYLEAEYPQGANLNRVEAQKKGLLEKTIAPLVILQTEIRSMLAAKESAADSFAVKQWEQDTKGLAHPDLALIRKLRQKVTNNTFASIDDFRTTRTGLEDARKKVTENGNAIINGVVESLRERNLTSPDRLNQERQKILAFYVSEIPAVVVELDELWFVFWETTYLDQEFGPVDMIVAQDPQGTVSEVKRKYELLGIKITDLATQAKRQLALDNLPNSGTIRTKGESKLRDRLAGVESKKKELMSLQYQLWVRDTMSETVDPLRRYKDALRAADAAAANGDETQLQVAENELTTAAQVLEGAKITATADLIAENKQPAEGYIDTLRREEAARYDALNDRRRQLETQYAQSQLDQEKTTLIDAINEIERIDYAGDQVREPQLAVLDHLLGLESRVIDAREALLLRGQAIRNVDTRYDAQWKKLQDLIERARIRRMTLGELVEQIKARKLNPYISNTEIQHNPDPTIRLILNTFQNYSPPEYATELEKAAEKADRTRAVIDMFASQFELGNASSEKMPSADTTKLYDYMDPKNWGLTREIILSFTKDEQLSPDGTHTVGENVQRMLRYGIEVVGKRKGKGGIYEPLPDELPFTYGELIKSSEGQASPKERLREFLHRKFVEEQQALTERDFDIAWKLFYTFDLFGIGLAKRQKWTQTRAHNTHFKDDPNYGAYPFHIAAHKLNRYGSEANSLLWLTLFTGKYPDKWARSGAQHGSASAPDADSLESHGGVQGMQHLVQEFTNTFTPIDNLANSIYSEDELDDFIEEKKREIASQRTDEMRETARHQGRNPNLVVPVQPDAIVLDREEARSMMWDQAVFPDHLEFLTKNLAGGREIQSLANYMTAKRGWENVLDMTIGDLKGVSSPGHVTLDDLRSDSGPWEQFIAQGIGLAKLVDGNHKKWFVPLTRYFIARISEQFEPHGEDELEGRKKLRDLLISRLRQAIADQEGGISGLGFEVLLAELETYDRSLGLLRAVTGGEKWVVLPQILRPRKTRTKERDHYVDLQFQHDHPHLKEHARLKGLYDSGITTRLMATAALAMSGYTAGDVDEYYDLRDREQSIHRPANRKKNTDTTQEKK